MAVLTNSEARCKAVECLALQGSQSVMLPVVNLMRECDFSAEGLQTFRIVHFHATVASGPIAYIDMWWRLKA